MAKPKRGQKMICVPCGRQVTIDACGISRTTLWCCDRPMRPKSKARKKSKKR